RRDQPPAGAVPPPAWSVALEVNAAEPDVERADTGPITVAGEDLAPERGHGDLGRGHVAFGHADQRHKPTHAGGERQGAPAVSRSAGIDGHRPKELAKPHRAALERCKRR